MTVPVWEVERFEGRQEIGRTRPLLVSAALAGLTGEPAEHRAMLVKAIGLPEVTETGLFSEYLGTKLAAEFGIDVPMPAIVNLSPELLNAARDTLLQWRLSLSPGLAVGVELRRGLNPFNRSVSAEGTAYEMDAVRLFAFDMLVQNADRRVENPNCGYFRGRLIAYDHEMAFSFLYPIINIGEPWDVPVEFAKKHLFHDVVSEVARGGKLDWQPIRMAVVAVSQRAEDLVPFLPTAWQENGRRVSRHLREVAARARDFEVSLEKSLL